MLDDLEEIARLRIAAWAEHAHQAFRRAVRPTTQFLEADRRVDVIAKERLPGIEISGEKTFNAFPQKLRAVLRIRSEARLHRLFELPRQRHFAAAPDLFCERQATCYGNSPVTTVNSSRLSWIPTRSGRKCQRSPEAIRERVLSLAVFLGSNGAGEERENVASGLADNWLTIGSGWGWRRVWASGRKP